MKEVLALHLLIASARKNLATSNGNARKGWEAIIRKLTK